MSKDVGQPEQRFQNRVKNHKAARLNLRKKLLLIGTGLAAMAIPLGIGLLNAVPTRAVSQDVPPPVFDAASIKRFGSRC